MFKVARCRANGFVDVHDVCASGSGTQTPVQADPLCAGISTGRLERPHCAPDFASSLQFTWATGDRGQSPRRRRPHCSRHGREVDTRWLYHHAYIAHCARIQSRTGAICLTTRSRFAPIARLAQVQNILIAHPTVPARTLKEFIRSLQKHNPANSTTELRRWRNGAFCWRTAQKHDRNRHRPHPVQGRWTCNQ